MDIPIGAWLWMMNETIQIETASGLDAYHERTYGAAASLRASVQGTGGRRVIDQRSGEEKVSSYVSYVASTQMVSPEDRITLPARCNPRQPPIIRIDPGPSIATAGIHHLAIYT